MLRTSAAVTTDGGMAPPAQHITKLANVIQIAGCRSITFDNTAERSPLACNMQNLDDVQTD